MTVSFEDTEAALVTKLRTLSFLDEDNCKAGKADECFRHISESSEKYLCITDYAGGLDVGQQIWAHSISIMFGIVVEGDAQIEEDIRALVDEFFALMLPEVRLSNGADVSIDTAQPPIQASRNEVPFVYLFFTVEALESMRRGC